MENYTNTILQVLEDIKAINTKTLDVRALTSMMDTLIVCTGRSTRHCKSIADKLIECAKKAGLYNRVQGQEHGEWVLVDLSDVVIHIMLPQVRDFYQLEKLWGISPKSLSDDTQTMAS